MKKIKPTQGNSHLQWMLCFLVACFLFSADLNAQSYTDLVSEAQAQTMLNSEIPVLENTMNNLTQGTPAHQLAERTYSLYVHTWEHISTGRNVEEALTSAYGEFAIDVNGNNLNEDELPGLSKTGPDYGDSAFDSLVSFLEE